MSSTAHIQVITNDPDAAFLPPVSAEILAARAAKRDYVFCLGAAMLTPVVMMMVAALIT